MLPWVWALLFSAANVCVAAGAKRVDDISTSHHESQWFKAENHFEEVKMWCQEWEGIRMRHCFDCFSYSRRVSSSFEKFGFRACNFDIRCSPEQDLLSRNGFFMALGQCMELRSCKVWFQFCRCQFSSRGLLREVSPGV